MQKTKRSFSLLEVLVAIVLASTACLFLLEFESSLIKRSRQSVQKIERERLAQQAVVKLFESLYTNQIPWQTIANGQSQTVPLTPELKEESWIAEYLFTVKKVPDMVVPTLMEVSVSIFLSHNNQEKKIVADGLYVCVKQEAGSDAIETPS